MLVTVDWIRRNYKKFNKEYFENKLPDLEFKVSRAKHTWGFAEFKYVYTGRKITGLNPCCITISNYYDSPEEVKLTTLLHEMIHIKDYVENPNHYITCTGRRRTGHTYDAHGWWFKEEAKKLKKYGWEIEKYVTQEEMSVSKLSISSKANLKKKKEVALACVVFSDKMAYIIKTDVNKIATIKKTIKRTPSYSWKLFMSGDIKSVKFYRSDNDKFAEKRSCATKLTGNRITIDTFENNYKNRLKLTEYKTAA